MQSTPRDILFPAYALEQCSPEELYELKVTLETMQDCLHQIERSRRLAELQATDRTCPTSGLTRLSFHRSEVLVILAGAALLGILLGLISLVGILFLNSRFV